MPITFMDIHHPTNYVFLDITETPLPKKFDGYVAGEGPVSAAE